MRVIWEIDVFENTPEKCARRALEMIRNPETTATIFRVEDGDETYKIDLWEDKEVENC